MSEKATAWVVMGPWDSKRSDLEFERVERALKGFFFDEDQVYEDSGTMVRACEMVMANGGSEALAILVPLAEAAGMWCRVGDEGGYGRERHNDTYAPDGMCWKMPQTGEGEVVMTESRFNELCASRDSERSIYEMEEYFDRGGWSLGQWIALEESER